MRPAGGESGPPGAVDVEIVPAGNSACIMWTMYDTTILKLPQARPPFVPVDQDIAAAENLVVGPNPRCASLKQIIVSCECLPMFFAFSPILRTSLAYTNVVDIDIFSSASINRENREANIRGSTDMVGYAYVSHIFSCYTDGRDYRW